MIALVDVARRAGVSPATVSRVLSDSTHPVRPETRERVQRAAAELGFVPNQLARALATSRTSTMGVIVHDIADPYFAEIVRGLEDGARPDGYRLLVCSSDRDPDRELSYVATLLSYRVDALIFAGGGLKDRPYQRALEQRLAAYQKEGGVVVALAPNAYKAPSVTPDNRGGAAAMTQHLAGLGHRRIGYIGGSPSVETSDHRLKGYRKGLEAAGLPWDPALAVPGSFDAAAGRQACADLLDSHADVTALFVASDVAAFGVLRELRARRISVPRDISVAGFDDVEMAELVEPPLTTMRARMHDVGALGAEMALKLLGGERVKSVVLDAEVVVRESTGPPPVRARHSASARRRGK